MKNDELIRILENLNESIGISRAIKLERGCAAMDLITSNLVNIRWKINNEVERRMKKKK